MAWFKRKNKKIQTTTEEKKDIPAGLWYKTQTGKIIDTKELSDNQYVSPEDDYHVHIGSKEYFEILFDNNRYTEIDSGIGPVDFLNFVDQKKYSDRIKESQRKTGLKDAIRVAYGKSCGKSIVIACMDFNFIGGSMGSVVGEKIVRAIDYSIKKKMPLLIISKSGGARMMESATSLMQMAKTAAKLNELSESKTPQVWGGSFFIRKCKKSLEMMDEHYQITRNRFDLIDDDESKFIEEKVPEFVQHRHSQSVLSLIVKKAGSKLLSAYESEWALN